MMAEVEIVPTRDPSLAVEVVGVYKSYGSGSSKIPVLKNLEMTVPKGEIYGLLGPSGCGKTTLLKCILGRLGVDEGHVVTLGKKPGSVGHDVPGKMVGYMPQELALYNEFTLGETLSFFGRLNKMTSDDIRKRTDFLLDFLHLPSKDRQVSKLSGGQQRRASFAIALLQEPEILILDEPTVGVDPLLRMRIWEHLVHISQTSNTSIIITTHYIEEARQANVVGLMRNGRILAEAKPDDLIALHQLNSLEDVFLKLCRLDQVGDIELMDGVQVPDLSATRAVTSHGESGRHDERQSLLAFTTPVVHVKRMTSIDQGVPTCAEKMKSVFPNCRNIAALIIKQLIILKRQIGMLLFEFFLPSFQIILFCVCIGREPYNLSMAVVNNETSTPFPYPVSSNIFLSTINNRTIIQNHFTDMNAAVESVKNGHNWGVIGIGENFTVDLSKRFGGKASDIDNATIQGSTVHLWLDQTNQQIFLTIEQEVLGAFQKFSQQMLSSLHMNPDAANIPVQVEEPIYGSEHPSFTNFMAPGIILSLTFFMATGLTALSFVLERKQGLLERSFIAGVKALEVMIGHICTQFLVMIVQVAGLLVFTFAVFEVTLQGSLLLVILLTLFQGFVGMALGMFISALCQEETSAIQAAIGSMYPSLLLSGIIWPIESMPMWLRYISQCLPMTLAADAMRCILARGWSFEHIEVVEGFLVSIAWGWGLLAITVIILKVRGV